MITEQQKRKMSVELEDLIWKYLNKCSESNVYLPKNDDLLGTRMSDAALLVLFHLDEYEQWMKEQGYLKDG